VAVVLLGGALAARPVAAASADPPREAERQAWLRASAAEADAALERLSLLLEEVVDSARVGSARIVSGEEPPGPDLEAAAVMLDGAGPAVAAARRALGELRGTLDGIRPDVGALAGYDVLALDPGIIAAQLRTSAAAAVPFVERRWATEATLEGLGEALAALDRDDPRNALRALDGADAELEVVANWENPPPSLPFWVDTTSDLLAAARAIAEAAIAGDATAAAIAAEAYAIAAERAGPADRSLALAMAEAGSAITTLPLRRLTDALGAIDGLRADVASIAAG
jgi:hypothetical protein